MTGNEGQFVLTALREGDGDDSATLAVGATVVVRNRYLGDWCSGFVVDEVVDDGYRIRRLSDGLGFPDVFAYDEVRPERRQHAERGIAGSYLDRRH